MVQLAIQSQDETVTRVRIIGRVTQESMANSEDPLSELVGPDVYGRIVLMDLSQTEYMDSSGLSWLLKLHRRFRERGGRLILYSLPSVVFNVIRVLNIHRVLDIAADAAEAERLARQQIKDTAVPQRSGSASATEPANGSPPSSDGANAHEDSRPSGSG